MDDLQRKQLKGLRFIFLRNNEDLPEDARRILKNMRGIFRNWGMPICLKKHYAAFTGKQRIHTMPEWLFTDGVSWRKKPEFQS